MRVSYFATMIPEFRNAATARRIQTRLSLGREVTEKDSWWLDLIEAVIEHVNIFVKPTGKKKA